ncbi:MAG: glycosyltransferase family 39 protein [Elusimicrobiota bacterium]|nr:glycosyltransferase family 39 protein [Elusimicrobiota bacterium]
MTLKDKLIKLSLLLIIVFLVISGFSLLGSSYLPFELVKVKIDALTVDGRADFLSIAFFEQMVVRLRFLGILLLLMGAVLYMGKRRAQQRISNMLTSFFSFLRELTQHFSQTVRKEDKIHLYTFFIVLLLAIVVRVFFLFQPMRYDEAFTFTNYVSRPLYIGLTSYMPNNHIFHTLLVRLAYLVFGNQPWIIRLPALFAGILLVPASYMVIRIFYDKYAALLTAGIVASSSALIEYSVNARGYTMLCLIFLLILALGTYLKESENSVAWLLFALLSALGFYTIPIMLYPLGIVIVWLFLSAIFKDTNLSASHLLKNMFLSLLVIAFLTFMLYFPVFAAYGLKIVVVAARSWSYLVAEFPPSLRSVWNHWNRGIPFGISFLFVIGFFTSLVFHRRLTIHRVPIILAVAMWCIPALVVHRVVPPVRVWLFLLPLYIGFASSGVSYLLRTIGSKINRYNYVIFGILTITVSFWLSLNVIHTKSVYYYQDNRTLRDAETITIFLKDYLKPGDRVLADCPSDAPLMYYFNLYDVPVEHFFYDLDSSYRILAIVHELRQTLEGLLREEGLAVTNYSVPELIRQYKYASLYEINRVNAGRKR